MKYIYTLFFTCFISLVACAQTELPELELNEKNKFKIIQITDTHFIVDNKASDVVPALLNEVIDAEKPDLIVFTGDMVWKNKGKTQKALDALFAPVIEKKIPWAYVFGNHDDEEEMSRSQIMSYVSQMPYCLAVAGDESLSGVGNYVLEVKSKKTDKLATVLYFMDSHAYSNLDGVKGYAWFEFDQIDWYRNQSANYTKLNGGKPFPALAFFHIPLAEYPEMKAAKRDLLVGNKDEDECNGKINTGMFAAMRIAGDVMGVFVGHDHDNDYIGKWHDIALAYGRYSGGNTVYNNLGTNGCRVIELTEGKRQFTSYIRLLGGEIIQKVEYPKSLK